MTFWINFQEYGIVHLATKNGGFDDGILYALKAINLTYAFEMEKLFKKDILIAEREVIERLLLNENVKFINNKTHEC